MKERKGNDKACESLLDDLIQCPLSNVYVAL